MPKYAKLMKELLSSKKKMEECSTAALYSECSAVMLKDLPKKSKDPGSFTIPCSIEQPHFKDALADLGASDMCLFAVQNKP